MATASAFSASLARTSPARAGYLSDCDAADQVCVCTKMSMNVGAVLVESPDNPTPDFLFTVEAVDRPGDGCSAPIDTDLDAAHVPDTHVSCRPGARPEFKVTFTNRGAPNSVPKNAADANGGYNMKLNLIGDGKFVVDSVPVYIIPAVVTGGVPVTQFVADGKYAQDRRIRRRLQGHGAPGMARSELECDVARGDERELGDLLGGQ